MGQPHQRNRPWLPAELPTAATRLNIAGIDRPDHHQANLQGSQEFLTGGIDRPTRDGRYLSLGSSAWRTIAEGNLGGELPIQCAAPQNQETNQPKENPARFKIAPPAEAQIPCLGVGASCTATSS